MNKTDNVRLLQDGVFPNSPSNDADGAILNLLNPKNNHKKHLSGLIDVAGSIITGNGQIVIAFLNKYNLGNFLDKKYKKHYDYYSLFIIKKLLKARGYSEFKFYGYSYGERGIAALNGGRFLASKNSTPSFKNIIRNKLIPNKVLSYFYPSYIVVASRINTENSDFFSIISKELNLDRHFELIRGKPNSAIIAANNLVIKIPLDKLSEARCRHNKIILERLKNEVGLDGAPNFIRKETIQNLPLYIEERIGGAAVDSPIKQMDTLVMRASEFIIDFHQKTAKEIFIDEKKYRILFEKKFNKLIPFLTDKNRDKLLRLSDFIRKSFLYKKIKLVWAHGDYKIGNVLFDMKSLRINGVIDWDLSSKSGLPLLDIFYLLFYKESLESRKSQFSILIERFCRQNFNSLEERVIKSYLANLNIAPELIKPLLLMFWLDSLTGRYYQILTSNSVFREEWFDAKINKIIDVIYSNIDLN